MKRRLCKWKAPHDSHPWKLPTLNLNNQGGFVQNIMGKEREYWCPGRNNEPSEAVSGARAA